MIGATAHAGLRVHQRLPTSGARGVTIFEHAGRRYLAIPQLARDIAGQAAHMNGGDSNTEVMLFEWREGTFQHSGSLPVPGGEGVEVFSLGGRLFLAAASLRKGTGPYDLNVNSVLLERIGEEWRPFQEFPTFAAKHWTYFEAAGRKFLALAQGLTMPDALAQARHPRHSCIYEWSGTRFVPFQTLAGGWGYGFAHFAIDERSYLAYADHTSASILYRFDGESFVEHQTLARSGGRAFKFFAAEGASWLCFAKIDGESTLFRWNGAAFEEAQVLGGPGGREFALIETDAGRFLVRVCFIQGTPAQPKTDLKSQIFRWARNRFDPVLEFDTHGATAASVFEADGQRYMVVSNSLTPDVRFRTDSLVYKLELADFAT